MPHNVLDRHSVFGKLTLYDLSFFSYKSTEIGSIIVTYYDVNTIGRVPNWTTFCPDRKGLTFHYYNRRLSKHLHDQGELPRGRHTSKFRR